VVQQATLSPPKSFRDSQRTPAALNRAAARACRPPGDLPKQPQRTDDPEYWRRVSPRPIPRHIHWNCTRPRHVVWPRRHIHWNIRPRHVVWPRGHVRPRHVVWPRWNWLQINSPHIRRPYIN
jgi:hypothetical protein